MIDANAYLALCVEFEKADKPHITVPREVLKELCLNYKPTEEDPATIPVYFNA